MRRPRPAARRPTLGGEVVTCTMPAAVRVELGDGDDDGAYRDAHPRAREPQRRSGRGLAAGRAESRARSTAATGEDRLEGGEGDDVLRGGDGNDTIEGSRRP